MITGFNTDIEHEGVIYHVQTEDKGLDSPLILSLVYSGGAILASKRSRYEDLIASGFDEGVLAQRVKRQHRLICAAINAGRLEELKRMGARAEAELAQTNADETLPRREVLEIPRMDAAEATLVVEAEAITETPEMAETPVLAADLDETQEVLPTLPGTGAKESPYMVYDPRRQAPEGEVAEPEAGLVLTVLDEDEFRAGESFTIRVLVQNRSGKKERPLTGVAVSVKILGTTFRPQIYSVKTERDGVAVVSTTMPNFTSGRAAVLIRAVAHGETTELRRVIHPAE